MSSFLGCIEPSPNNNADTSDIQKNQESLIMQIDFIMSINGI